jgi:hypothetical protein
MRQKIKSNKKPTDKGVIKKIIELRGLIIIPIIVLYFSFLGVRLLVKNYMLDHAVEVRAVIVGEKNFWGNSPVSHTFSYSYEFVFEGVKYRADSHNQNMKVGDSVLIEYSPLYPGFNRIVKLSE